MADTKNTQPATETAAPATVPVAATPGTVEIRASVSMKDFGDPRQALIQNKNIYMCRLIGEVADAKTKESKMGPYTYFLGNFRATGANGVTLETEKLFLPGGLAETLNASFKMANGKPIQFGIDVFSTPNPKQSIGYQYAQKSFLQAETSNRLDMLAASVKDIPLPQAPATTK